MSSPHLADDAVQLAVHRLHPALDGPQLGRVCRIVGLQHVDAGVDVRDLIRQQLVPLLADRRLHRHAVLAPAQVADEPRHAARAQQRRHEPRRDERPVALSGDRRPGYDGRNRQHPGSLLRGLLAVNAVDGVRGGRRGSGRACRGSCGSGRACRGRRGRLRRDHARAGGVVRRRRDLRELNKRRGVRLHRAVELLRRRGLHPLGLEHELAITRHAAFDAGGFSLQPVVVFVDAVGDLALVVFLVLDLLHAAAGEQRAEGAERRECQHAARLQKRETE